MANKKEKKIKIDIILPNFNSSDSIKETIKSIIDQTFKNWKLIIVDDCSDKKTKTILKKFSKNKKIKIFWLKRNKGAGYCRNYAIKKSKSPYLAFIDSDDIWKKDKLETQLRFMENNNYLFTYTNYETFGKKIILLIYIRIILSSCYHANPQRALNCYCLYINEVQTRL